MIVLAGVQGVKVGDAVDARARRPRRRSRTAPRLGLRTQSAEGPSGRESQSRKGSPFSDPLPVKLTRNEKQPPATTILKLSTGSVDSGEPRCSLIGTASRANFHDSLVAEILVLRHQINIQRRHLPKRQTFGAMDRLIFAGLYRLAPTILNALAILKPETVMEWHRVGFRSFWRLESRRRGGRPTVPLEIGKLIREMSIANPLWGAPRIHGELLKLGIDVGPTSVAKYMVKRRGPPSQGWKTFLHNHADGIAAMDMFVVPTISFRPLYGLLIMGHGRR